MSIKSENKRREVAQAIRTKYKGMAYKLCWQDYWVLVEDYSTSLCQQVIEEKLYWTQSKHSKLFNMAYTAASDAHKAWDVDEIKALVDVLAQYK